MGNLIYAWPILIIPAVIIICGLMQWARGAGVGPRQCDERKLKAMEQALYQPGGAWHRAPIMHRYFSWYPENDRDWQDAFSLAEAFPEDRLYPAIESLNEQRSRIIEQNERIARRTEAAYMDNATVDEIFESNGRRPRILPVATRSSH